MFGKKNDEIVKTIVKKEETDRFEKLRAKGPFTFAAIPKLPMDESMSNVKLYVKFSDTLSQSIFSMYK